MKKGKETISSLEGLIGTLQDSYDVLKKLIKILKCNLMFFGQALQSLQAHPKLLKPPSACRMLILMLFMLKVNIPMLSKCL
jgi:hypothetical protein